MYLYIGVSPRNQQGRGQSGQPPLSRNMQRRLSAPVDQIHLSAHRNQVEPCLLPSVPGKAVQQAVAARTANAAGVSSCAGTLD